MVDFYQLVSFEQGRTARSEGGLVDHWDQQAIDGKPGRVGDGHRRLAKAGGRFQKDVPIAAL